MYLLRCDVQVPLSKGNVLILQDNFWEGVDSSKGSSDRITNEVGLRLYHLPSLRHLAWFLVDIESLKILKSFFDNDFRMVEKQGNWEMFLTMSRRGGPNIGGYVWGTFFFPSSEGLRTYRFQATWSAGNRSGATPKIIKDVVHVVTKKPKVDV